MPWLWCDIHFFPHTCSSYVPCSHALSVLPRITSLVNTQLPTLYPGTLNGHPSSVSEKKRRPPLLPCGSLGRWGVVVDSGINEGGGRHLLLISKNCLLILLPEDPLALGWLGQVTGGADPQPSHLLKGSKRCESQSSAPGTQLLSHTLDEDRRVWRGSPSMGKLNPGQGLVRKTRMPTPSVRARWGE